MKVKHFGCENLVCVTIGNGVTKIGYYAFYGCYNLRDVCYSGTKEEWGKITIEEENTPLLDATFHFSDEGPLDPSIGCACNCHKSGISNFFFKFVLFFQRIFGANKSCSCGIAHY